jgi:tRNA (cmo5U34)-methyltransferase
MDSAPDSNAAIWKSEAVVQRWVEGRSERDAKRAAHWRIMGELLPFDEDEAFSFLDLGAGTGAAAGVLLDLFPKSSAVLADFSPQMRREGERALARHEGRFRYVAYDLLDPSWPEEIPTGLDAVVTSLCIHHIPDERKAQVFMEIFDHLAPAGWYVNYDPVTSEDPVVDAAWARANERQDPEAAEKARHRSAEEEARHEAHIRHMAPLAPQLDWLRAAGFEAIDVYWKCFENVIYAGRRPA